MQNIRKDLIHKEFDDHPSSTFKALKLNNRFLDNLTRKYLVESIKTCWYDSKSEIPTEFLYIIMERDYVSRK